MMFSLLQEEDKLGLLEKRLQRILKSRGKVRKSVTESVGSGSDAEEASAVGMGIFED